MSKSWEVWKKITADSGKNWTRGELPMVSGHTVARWNMCAIYCTASHVPFTVKAVLEPHRIFLAGALENRAQFHVSICFAINLMPFHFLSFLLLDSVLANGLVMAWSNLHLGTGLENFLVDNYLPFVPWLSLLACTIAHESRLALGKPRKGHWVPLLCGLSRELPTKKGQMQKRLPWPKCPLVGGVKLFLWSLLV